MKFPLNVNETDVCCRGIFYSPEELVAMILQKAKEYTETFAGTLSLVMLCMTTRHFLSKVLITTTLVAM